MTDNNEPEPDAEDETQPELRDPCGATVADETEWYALVLDQIGTGATWHNQEFRRWNQQTGKDGT